MKKLVLLSLCMLGLSACNPDTISYSVLEKGHTLYVVANTKSCFYRQEESRCYASNNVVNDYFDGTLYYSFSNEHKTLSVKIKGETTYTFYHYTIDTWCVL